MRPLQQQQQSQPGVFSQILNVRLPESVSFNPVTHKSQPFSIKFTANGDIPFPQIIIRSNGQENILNGDKIRSVHKNEYIGEFPEGYLPVGTHSVQIEGCRKNDWQHSNGDDWIKWFGEMKIISETPSVKPATPKVTVNKKKNLM